MVKHLVEEHAGYLDMWMMKKYTVPVSQNSPLTHTKTGIVHFKSDGTDMPSELAGTSTFSIEYTPTCKRNITKNITLTL